MGEEEGSASSWRLVVTIDIVCQSHSGEGSEHHHHTSWYVESWELVRILVFSFSLPPTQHNERPAEDQQSSGAAAGGNQVPEEERIKITGRQSVLSSHSE